MSEYVAYLHMTSLPKKDKKCHYIREEQISHWCVTKSAGYIPEPSAVLHV